MSRGHILVIRGGAIGDFILTLPVLAALRKTFPATRLEVLGYPHIASLAALGGYVADVRSIEARPLAGFFARGGTLDPALCEYFAGFNIIVSFLYDPDEIFRANVARCSKAQFIAGAHRPNEAENVHATDVFLRALERLAIFGADAVPRLPMPAQPPHAAPMLAVHPGSGSERKNWPEEHWVALLKRVADETDWRILLVGGEAEQDRLQRLATIIPVQRLAVAASRPLPDLAQRLALCRAFLGHDSGITHLAAATGASGTALWGETNPKVWRPRSEKFDLLRGTPGLVGIAPSEVFAAITPKMRGAA